MKLSYATSEVNIGRCIHVDENARVKWDDGDLELRDRVAQCETTLRERRLERRQRAARVRARQRPCLRNGDVEAAVGELVERRDGEMRHVDRHDHGKLVARGAQARHDSDERRAELRAVVQDVERKLDLPLADGYALV